MIDYIFVDTCLEACAAPVALAAPLCSDHRPTVCDISNIKVPRQRSQVPRTLRGWRVQGSGLRDQAILTKDTVHGLHNVSDLYLYADKALSSLDCSTSVTRDRARLKEIEKAVMHVIDENSEAINIKSTKRPRLFNSSSPPSQPTCSSLVLSSSQSTSTQASQRLGGSSSQRASKPAINTRYSPSSLLPNIASGCSAPPPHVVIRKTPEIVSPHPPHDVIQEPPEIVSPQPPHDVIRKTPEIVSPQPPHDVIQVGGKRRRRDETVEDSEEFNQALGHTMQWSKGQLRRRIFRAFGEERALLVQRLRHMGRVKRQAKASMATLKILQKTPMPKSTIPQYLLDTDNQTKVWDRNQWSSVLDKFGYAKYNSDGGVSQFSVLSSLDTLLSQDFANGGQVFTPDFHFTLQAFAKLSHNKAHGQDFIPAELYKCLPFIMRHDLHRFLVEFCSGSQQMPTSWNVVGLAGIPKTIHAHSLCKFRWVGKQSQGAKAMVRAISTSSRFQAGRPHKALPERAHHKSYPRFLRHCS